MPPRWLAAVLKRIRDRADEGSVRFTIKALQELAALEMGLDEEDARDVLARLSPQDFVERLMSDARVKDVRVPAERWRH